MPRAIDTLCYAKINWTLHVLAKRPDGFHELETLFQSISLADRLIIREAAADRFECDDPAVPADSSNLVVRAVDRLRAIREFPPLHITLEKSVPAGGGLGGGSCNAAMTLQAIDRLFDLCIDRDTLAREALELGSDVPFFLRGGLCYATGRGEQLKELHDTPELPMLLVLPEERVITSRAFARLASLRSGGFAVPELNGEAWAADAIARQRFDQFRNDLEPPVFADLPQLERYKHELLRFGALFALMSGSGSTLFGVFDDRGARDRAASALGPAARAVTPVPRSVATGR